jgi:beta-lactam-binding protein with PASTA domain
MSFFENFSETNLKNPATIIKILVGAIAVIGLSFAATYFYMDSITKVIPDLSSSNIFDVQHWMEENNLTTEQVIITKEYNEDVDVDQVISQSIEAENNLADEPLTIIISKGKDPNLVIDLIDFTDMNEDDIKSWFTENLFIDVTVEYEASIDIETEKLIRINVEETAKRSEMIVITMSVGSKSIGIEIIIPDFADYTKANIEAWSNTNNIEINYAYAYSDDIEKGKVIMQDPKANTTALTGSEGTVTISKGKAIIISDFINDKESEITSWAKTNGIILKKLTIYSSKSSGLIVSTNPKAKTTISVGSTIQYELSTGLVTLENYVSKTKSSFTTYIEELNKENNKSANISIQYKESSSDTIVSGSIVKMEFGSSEYDSSSDTELKVNPSTSVIVTISTGKAYTVISKTGSTEASFISYCTNMNLKTYKSSEKYSETISKGSIISNETGQYGENDTVTYILSKGTFTPVMSDYQNMTISSAQSKLSTYISNGAPSSWNIVKGTYVDSSNTSDNTVDCTSSGTTITCTISKGVAVNVVSYTGKTFSEFNTYLNSKNLVLGTKTSLYSNDYASGIIISNETISKYAGETVYYSLSLGDYDPTNHINFQNKTIAEAQATLNDEVPDYLNEYSLVKSGEAVYHDTVDDGNIIECTYSNYIVSCTVSKGIEPETPTTFYLKDLVPEEDHVTFNPEITKSNIESYLNSQNINQFFNINIIVPDDKTITSGMLIDYPSEGYKTRLSTDSKLEIIIADYQIN